MNAFSATESKRIVKMENNERIKTSKSENERKDVDEASYLFRLPVTYAQTVTRTNVNAAPANPETTHFMLISAGSTAISQGMMYSAVTCASTPAMKPNTATIANTLILSLIQIHLFASALMIGFFLV
jgi:hypothetical protein